MGDKYDAIVIGGGPGGSTVAGDLARLGYRVLVLERLAFPRHRIGESLLPSMMPVLEDFGLVDACRDAGFVKKTGATFIWGKTSEPWSIRFEDTEFLPSSFAFHVERSVFDQILLDHARGAGAEVHNNATVLGAITDDGRIVGVTYRNNETGDTKSVRGRFVVDASGSASVIGRNVSERRYDDQMRQLALYSYFNNVRRPQDFRAGHIIVESCPKGWFWFIPIDSDSLGEISLGLVTGQEFRDEINEKGPRAFFDEARSEAPYIRELLGPDAVCSQRMYGVRDWAYTSDETAGPGYYLVGDAAAFLDPLLSTGVSLAMLAGYSASVCINSVLQDPAMETQAAGFYSNNYRQMYEVTRDFLHYFYSGNGNAYPDEIFWKARKMLNFDHNIAAKQAFTFFINTIPGNPHPALAKQIPLFHQFMENIAHPLDEMKEAPGIQRVVDVAKDLRKAGRLADEDVPIVNGRLESTWRIDRESHALAPVHGVTFDRERPVFSSTSSWLLGRNVAQLPDRAWRLLGLMDGTASWASIVGRYAEQEGLTLDEGRARTSEIVAPLLAEGYVLLRSTAEPSLSVRDGHVNVDHQAVSTEQE